MRLRALSPRARTWLSASFQPAAILRAAPAPRSEPATAIPSLISSPWLTRLPWSLGYGQNSSACTGRAFSGAHAALGIVDRRGLPVVVAITPNAVDQRLFQERYQTADTNPGLRFVATTAPLTVEVREQQVCDRDLVKLDYYHDIMRPAGLWHAAIANVHRDKRFLAALGIARSRSQGRFTAAELGWLRRRAPHLNRAARVSIRFKEMEARTDAVAEAVDRVNVGVALTDASGRLAHVNRSARAILDARDGLTIVDGVLRATKHDDSCRLARLIRAAAGGEAPCRLPRLSGAMQASRPSLRRPLPVVVSPTRNAASPFDRSSAVCITFADPDRASKADPELLARLYGLTEREAAVAACLLQGQSPNAAAAALAMTMNTVRTHIRHIFEKTGVERMSELMRLFLSGPAAGMF
jgi:DNA-binding CsgD family transcriptional regulator